jgi:hypothetical protein
VRTLSAASAGMRKSGVSLVGAKRLWRPTISGGAELASNSGFEFSVSGGLAERVGALPAPAVVAIIDLVQLIANRKSTSLAPLPVRLIGLANSCTSTPILSASPMKSQKATSSAGLPSTPGISIRSTFVACGAIQTESSLRLCAQLSHNARSVVLSTIAWSMYHCVPKKVADNSHKLSEWRVSVNQQQQR